MPDRTRDVWLRLHGKASAQVSDDEQPGKRASERHSHRCHDVKGGYSWLPAFVQQRRIEREGREGCEAAENARGQEQPPCLKDWE